MLPYKLTLYAQTNVVLSGPWNLTDGDYSIVCILSGSNSLVNQTTISVRAGVASFQILPLKFWERPTLQLAELLILPQISIQRLCLNLFG
jgi:hypothetical protein